MRNFKLEPYENILTEHYRLNKQFIHIIYWIILYFSIFLISIIFSWFGYCTFPLLKPNRLMIISSFLASGAWIYAMWQYDRISKIESKRYREIEDAITPKLETMARKWYGRDWHKALRECIEAHLPGDCPLCGAE